MTTNTQSGVDDIVSSINATRGKRLLTASNFTVESVVESIQNGTNTLVTYIIDNAAGSNEAIPQSERYSRKQQRITRYPITEAVVLAGLTLNDAGHLYLADITDLPTILSQLATKIAIDPSEVVYVNVGTHQRSLTFKPTSLGFTGRLTLTDIVSETISCVGATNTSGALTLTGTFDVYIDDMEVPKDTGLTAAQLAAKYDVATDLAVIVTPGA